MWIWTGWACQRCTSEHSSRGSLPGHSSLSSEHRYHPSTLIQGNTVLHNNIRLVQGHAGKLLFGFFADDAPPVVLMVGRAQFVFAPELSVQSELI
jgi:hypothetical protein